MNPSLSVPRRTVEEWEAAVGAQLRELRLEAGLPQTELARRADLSVTAVKSIEAGLGSSLTTLIKVARALGREEWLTEVDPPRRQTTSPLELLRAQQAAEQTRTRRAPPRKRSAR